MNELSTVGQGSISSPRDTVETSISKPFEHKQMTEENLLLTMATPLMTLMTTIRHTVDQKDVPKFRAQIIDEIKSFEKKIQASHITPRTIAATRYCLCAAIDEAVLAQHWGAQSLWTQGSLLSYFHKETCGGERFYIILEEFSKDPSTHIDFIELAYALLSLGFEGKYYGEHSVLREDLRNRIFHRIRFARQKPDKLLSPHLKEQDYSQKQGHKKNFLQKKHWLMISLSFTIIVILNLKACHKSKETLNKLSEVATTSPITVFSDMLERPLIKRSMPE